MAVTYPTTIPDRAKLYLHCMVELRERLRVVRTLLDWKIPALFVRELAYLQLRHACEVLAIACLAAQGDFKTQRAFREEYRPSLIFKALRKQYPAFFPHPAIMTSTEDRHHIGAPAYSEAYDEAQVIDLWDRAGDRLHRLSVAKYLKKTFQPEDPSTADLEVHLNGMGGLLLGHTVALGDPTQNKHTVLYVEAGEDGRITAMFMHLDKEAGSVRLEEYHAKLA